MYLPSPSPNTLDKRDLGTVRETRELTCSNAGDAVIASFFQPKNVPRMERNGEEKCVHTAVFHSHI